MKRLLIVVFSLQLLVVFTNCSKEKEDKKLLIENVWAIDGMKQHADSTWENLYYNTYLSFIGEDRYVLQTMNSCSIGKVEINKNYKIKFGGITGMLPSYPYTDKVGASHILFMKISHYEVKEGNLVLKGDNGEVISLIRIQRL